MATHSKKAIPGKKVGGARAGAGRKSPTEEAVQAYHALEKIRTEGRKLTEDEAALLREAREVMLGVMRNPSRYAQQKIIAAKHFIEEIAGKVPDQLDASVQQTIVEVVKSSVSSIDGQGPREIPGANIIALRKKEDA